MTFTEWYLQNKDPNNLFDPPMSVDQALNFLEDYLLPDNYYIDQNAAAQARTEIVYDILMKYSKKFKKEVKQYDKFRKQCNKCNYCPNFRSGSS